VNMAPPYQNSPGSFGVAPTQSVYRPTPGNYEFNETENSVLRGLANKMKLVAFAQIASLGVGALSMVVTVARMSGSSQRIGGIIGGSVGVLFGGVLSAFIAYFMWRSAAAFERVVQTRGDDVPNLIDALSSQSSYFAMLKWLVVAAFTLTIVAMAGACLLR
jgi:hypothetical protein